MKLQKKYNLIQYLLCIVLSSSVIQGCDDSSSEDDSDTSSVSTSETETETSSNTLSVTDLTMQPGSDESKVNFAWYTTDTSYSEVQIALKSDMTDSDFPELFATTYTGTVVTSESGDEEEHLGRPASTDTESTSKATTDDDTDTTSDDDTETTVTYLSNEVEVSDLEPNTEYVYRVSDGSTYSDIYYFTTKGDSSYNFIVVGDPQIGSSGSVSDDQSGWEATLTQAIDTYPDTSFILGVGDQINTSTDEDEYTAFFTADELSSIPFSSAIGNHDNNTLYQYHFNTANESSDYGTTDAGGDYYYTYGDALFMVLNTNNSSATSHESFIEETINNVDSDIVWKIVVLHHSIYSSASHSADTSILELRSGLYPVFDDNDIDVVLMGHDHVYSRSYQMYDNVAQTDQTTDEDGYVVDPTGTLYVTFNSASGSKYYDLEENDSAYRAVRWQGEEPSYSNVEITESTFVVTTYTADDNEEIDTYGISKTIN